MGVLFGLRLKRGESEGRIDSARRHGLYPGINNQIHDLNTQSPSYLNQAVNCDVLFSPFDESNVIPVNIRIFGQFLLR